MKRLRKFAQLSKPERHLLIEAFMLIGTIKLTLMMLPFKTVRRLLNKAISAAQEAQPADPSFIRMAVWSVDVASSYVPRTKTCLPRALTVQMLLGRRGYPVQLHLGVARDEMGGLKGHAWVEYQGQAIIGGEQELAFIPLSALESHLS